MSFPRQHLLDRTFILQERTVVSYNFQASSGRLFRGFVRDTYLAYHDSSNCAGHDDKESTAEQEHKRDSPPQAYLDAPKELFRAQTLAELDKVVVDGFDLQATGSTANRSR